MKKRSFIFICCYLWSMVYTISCTVKSKIEITGGNPPTFTVSGQPRAFFFAVSEVAPENYQATPWNNEIRLNRQLWGVNLQNNQAALRGEISGIKQIIVYGQTPTDFTQTFPPHNKTEPLIPGHIYEAVGGSSCCENTPDIIWFKIEDGHPVIVKGGT